MEPRTPPERIRTERLELRRHELSVAPAMFAAVDSDRARLRQFLPWVDRTLKEADSIAYIERCQKEWGEKILFDYGVFLLNAVSDGGARFIGTIGAHHIQWESGVAELGYWIHGEFEGLAYVSEAVLALEKTLFELGFYRLEIRCDPSNTRSAKIPERLEYLLEGRLRGNTVVGGVRRDTRIYGRLRTEAGFPWQPAENGASSPHQERH